MIEVKLVNRVQGGMNPLVAVFELGFDDEGRRVAGFVGGGMVRACISTVTYNEQAQDRERGRNAYHLVSTKGMVQYFELVSKHKGMNSSDLTVLTTSFIKSVRPMST